MPRVATIEKMVQVIRDSEKPVLTKSEIADGIGVSWQTIANHEDELQDDPRVDHGQVGKSTAYWLADEPDTHASGGVGQSGPVERDLTGSGDTTSDSDPDSAETRGVEDYNTWEKRAHYIGLSSATFSLALSLIFTVRFFTATMFQWSISPTIPTFYYSFLALSLLLLGVAAVMSHFIKSGALRNWTADLSEDEVEGRFRAVGATGWQWVKGLGIAYIAFAATSELLQGSTLPIPSQPFLWMAALLIPPLVAVAALTAIIYVVLGLQKAYWTYSRFSGYLPEQISTPEESGRTANSQTGAR